MPGPVSAWMGDHLGQVNHIGTDPGTHFNSACTIPLSVGKNEYPELAVVKASTGEERKVTRKVGPVTRTASILAVAYSWLKALAVNRPNHPADVCHMLA